MIYLMHQVFLTHFFFFFADGTAVFYSHEDMYVLCQTVSREIKDFFFFFFKLVQGNQIVSEC